MDLREFQRYRDEINRLRREADEAAGAYRQFMEQLKEEHGVKNLKQAKRLLKRLRAKARKTDKLVKQALEEFLEKRGDKL